MNKGLLKMKTKTCKKQMVELLACSIGSTCYKYILFLFKQNDLSDFELHIFLEIFSKPYYSKDVLDAACFTALVEIVQTVDAFEKFLTEVNASFRDYG